MSSSSKLGIFIETLFSFEISSIFEEDKNSIEIDPSGKSILDIIKLTFETLQARIQKIEMRISELENKFISK